MSTASYEDKPNLFYDAYMVQVPVVATNIPGQREAFEHEKSGLLIPPGNAETCAKAIERIFEDSVLQKKLVDGALEHLQKTFSWEVHEKKLLIHFVKTV